MKRQRVIRLSSEFLTLHPYQVVLKTVKGERCMGRFASLECAARTAEFLSPFGIREVAIRCEGQRDITEFAEIVRYADKLPVWITTLPGYSGVKGEVA